MCTFYGFLMYHCIKAIHQSIYTSLRSSFYLDDQLERGSFGAHCRWRNLAGATDCRLFGTKSIDNLGDEVVILGRTKIISAMCRLWR